MTKEESLSKQELKREMILNGPLWKTLLQISMPLVFFNLCNYLYGVYDMMVVSNVGIGNVGSIAFFDQVKIMIATVGGAIATSGGILIARYFGSGDFKKAQKMVNTTFTICLVIALLLIGIFVPFASTFLKLMSATPSMINDSLGYFQVQMIALAMTTINNVFVAEEKAKGNTKSILYLNLGVVAIKIILTTIIANLYKSGMTFIDTTWIALATVMAQAFMFICGLVIIFSKNNVLGLKLHKLKVTKDLIKPLLIVALPVFIGRFLFSFGKVNVQTALINAYTPIHGEAFATLVVGALGISNTITGLPSNIFNSFEDGLATVISQNYGAKNGKRTIDAFKINIIYVISIGLVCMLLLTGFQTQIAQFFSPGQTSDDVLKREMIFNIVKYERLDILFMAIQSCAFGYLYGYGRTRITMILSSTQLFLFRIPSLYFMLYVLHMNYECAGIAMLFSNAVNGVISFILVILIIINMKKNPKYHELKF